MNSRAGLSAELYASGSPKKRYDKAVKAEPSEIISIDVRDDAPTLNRRTLRDGANQDAVAAVLAGFTIA